MTVTFEQIAKANEAIRTMTITRQNRRTGEVTAKEYAEVNQRVKSYRMVYPSGRILTEMVSNADGVCIFRATIYDEGDRVLSTGTAFERQDASQINQTSYIENCETSAVGRALGLAGFGIDTSIASYEEVKNAQGQQDAKEEAKKEESKAKPKKAEKTTEVKATEAQVALLKELLSGNYPKDLCDWLSETFGVNSKTEPATLTVKTASELIKWGESVVRNWWMQADPTSRANMLKTYGVEDVAKLTPMNRMNAAKVITEARR